MKIALIGYGAMGRLIKVLAEEKGHAVDAVLAESDPHLSVEEFASKLNGVDVAIDFTAADAVQRNVEACLIAGVPIVVGTTGWNDQIDEIKRLVNDSEGAMVYGANFSIGVNLFYKIAEFSAELFAKFPEYEVFIEEQHHSRKKDAPSGTALKLKQLVNEHIEADVEIAATRAGNIPGTHRVGFDAAADQILLTHTARSREGFAIGAITAAEWIIGKKGFYDFTDLMDDLVTR